MPPEKPPAASAPVYLDRLDSLRFLAAVAIIGWHGGHTVPCGWMGVSLFFVLSGFLITGILIRLRNSGEGLAESLWYFFVRRCLRILPLYFGYLVILLIFLLASGHPAALLREMPYLLTYTLNFARMQDTYPSSMAYDHLWSLAVEWQFYLLWPFLILFVPGRYTVALLIGLVFASPLIRALTILAVQGTSLERHVGEVLYYSTWSYVESFALGALLNFERVAHFFRRGPVIALATMAFLLAVVNGYPVKVDYVWMDSAVFFAMTCLVAVAMKKSRLDIVIDRPLMQRLGRISYGIYVYHGGIVAVLMAVFPFISAHSTDPVTRLKKIAISLVILAAAIPVAHYSYWWLELPFLKLKKFVKGPRVAVKPPRGDELTRPPVTV